MLEIIDLSLLQIIFAVVVITIAYTVKGLSGFGSGLIAIPLLAFFFPLKLIVPIFALLSYTGTIYQSYILRREAQWADILPLIPFSFLGIAIAVWLLMNIQAELLTLALGLFVVLYAIYSLLPQQDKTGSRYWAIPAGIFGGMIGALFSTGGPFYVLYLKLRQLAKGPFRATIATIFLIDGGARIAAYAMSGLYTIQVLTLVMILWPLLFLGLWIGHHLHIKIKQQQFNLGINTLLVISGGMLVYKSLLVLGQ
ncbi:MAG: sulfite exporter TauE/SafE family protein [Gammaproteobacteria bacterium]|nr:sulfite exporter TauE/SafE family protein [Gammaproteobacteria bacterium]